MHKFILLILISFLLMLQDFPPKKIDDLSVRISAKYKKAVGERQKLISELTLEQCLNTNRNFCLLVPALYLYETETAEFAELFKAKNEIR